MIWFYLSVENGQGDLRNQMGSKQKDRERKTEKNQLSHSSMQLKTSTHFLLSSSSYSEWLSAELVDLGVIEGCSIDRSG